MKKKLIDIVFIALFMAVMTVPLLLINTKPFQKSEIDNKNLQDWPVKFTLSAETRDSVERYFNDRIGFRERAIDAYTVLCDKLFHVMVHPLFMYGEKGNIYYKNESYILGYQRLNTDRPMLDDFTDFLRSTQEYLDSRNVNFLFFMSPDKKTIYPEYFPKTIHVDERNDSVPEYLEEKLQEKDINYIIPIGELNEAKKTEQIYNVQFDATHWNEYGAMVAHKLIDEQVQEWYGDVPKFTEEDYNLKMVHKDTLETAHFAIDENVPVYELKNDVSQDATYYLMNDMELDFLRSFYSHHMNPDAGNSHILLMFVDSYFGPYPKYYSNRFREVYMVHRDNYDKLQYYVNLLCPDTVIFEVAERSILEEFSTEKYDFSNYEYEPPYDTELSWPEGGAVLTMDINDVTGAELAGDKLVMEEGDLVNMIQVEGALSSDDPDGEYDIYVHAGEAWLEADYHEQRLQSEQDGMQYFTFAIQKRYISGSNVDFVVVDRKNKNMYTPLRLEVGYE